MKVGRCVLICVNINFKSVDLLNEGTTKENDSLTVWLYPNVTAGVQKKLQMLRQFPQISNSV